MTLLRTLMYLWVAIELANVAYLYYYGYKNIKNTPIIKWLQLMLSYASGVMFFIAFMPVMLELRPEIQRIFINFVILPLAVFGYSVRMFRKESITKKEMPLPDRK